MKRNNTILSAVLAHIYVLGTVAYDQRPQYHITPELGQWMNDPNGPMYFNGYYHLFFQDNPYGTVWGNMSWAHVISKDLVHWERLPIALYNDQSYDIGGVFSGSAAIKNDIPYLFYTCVNAEGVELQCVAQPQDASNTSLEVWNKDSSNPIINSMPAGWDGINFRDPTLWELPKEEGVWNMITAASDTGNGIIALYTTPDSAFPYNWEYPGPLWSSDDVSAGFRTWMVECPDFFSGKPSSSFQRDAGDLYVLKYSIMETTQEFYEVGTYASDVAAGKSAGASTFVRDVTYSYPYQTASYVPNVQHPGLLLDYGPNGLFYASKTFFDGPNNQRLLWGWSRESDDNAEGRDWQGVQSLPRQVELDTTNKVLRTRPASQVQALRKAVLYEFTHSDDDHDRNNAAENKPQLGKKAAENAAVEEHDVPASGLQLEIQAKFTATAGCSVDQLDGWEFGVHARRSKDGASYTKYGFGVQNVTATDTSSAVKAVAVLDSSRSGGSSPALVVHTPVPAEIAAIEGELTFSMQLFLDHSMTELYLEDGALAATLRVYPPEQQQGLSWYLSRKDSDNGCSVRLQHMIVYSMGTIWKA